eukprot:TRINITY_DN11418_c0_g1_i14.p1 TRINITY_DN11418_c0_g1~~TRINITY_DN11418_c0_g1_i14.p1  ORF type:complete len:266 (-),score=37.52 TRINITY_DN11418_c0_g1_i14:948-1745(-)
MKICVNCGNVLKDKHGRIVDEVYDQSLYKKSGIMKLLECQKCVRPADRYIEYEGCLVMLDVALQSPAALRHVIVNKRGIQTSSQLSKDNETSSGGTSKLILKLAFVTLIIDGLVKWSDLNRGLGGGDGDFGGQGGSLMVEQEFQFYSQVGASICCFVAYYATCLLIYALNKAVRDLLGKEDKSNFSNLALGLLLAYCVRCTKLLALLWEPDRSGFLWIFIDLVFLVTTYTVLKVFGDLNRPQSLITALISHSALHFMQFVNKQIT